MKKNIFKSGFNYNLFYDDKNYIDEAKYIHETLIKNRVSGNLLLELGSGTGRHAGALSDLGYKILGVEQSESMINEVVKSKNFECIKGDIRNIKIKKKFDAVISLFHVMSYQISNESLKSAFKTAFQSLKSKGIFIFDAWYGPAVLHQKPLIKVKRISVKSIEITRIAEPEIFLDKNTVNVKYTFYKLDKKTGLCNVSEENHLMRFFSIPEIEYIANDVGFEIVNAEELTTSKKPSLDTWGICFILKKIK